MHKSDNHWKWPKTIDKILYARDDIVQILCQYAKFIYQSYFGVMNWHTLMKFRLVRPSQYIIAIFKIKNKNFLP